MNDTDNFKSALNLINSAFVTACGGHYEPKSVRDLVLATHLKHLLDVIHSPAFNEMVRKEELRAEANAWVKEMMGE